MPNEKGMKLVNRKQTRLMLTCVYIVPIRTIDIEVMIYHPETIWI